MPQWGANPLVLGGQIRADGKNQGPPGDYQTMQVSCEVIRESISAALDAESTGLPSDDIDRHLAGCDACRAWQEAAHEVTRQFRLQAAEDLASVPAPLRADVVGTASRRRPSQVVVARAALVAAGIAQLLVTSRLLLSGDIDSFRDLGALEVALGVGYLVAAALPRRAAGMRSIVGTAALLLVASALLDLVHHRTTAFDEAPHLIAVAGWLLIVFLAWRTPEFGAPPSAFRRWAAVHRRSEGVGVGQGAIGWGETTAGGSSAWAQTVGTGAGWAGGSGALGTHDVLGAQRTRESHRTGGAGDQRRAAGE